MDQTKEQYTHIQKIKLLYQQSVMTIGLSAISALFLTAILWRTVDQQHLLIWLTIITGLAMSRIILVTSFKHISLLQVNIKHWEHLYSFSFLISVVVWSAGLIYFLSADNLTNAFILNTFAVALAITAITWNSQLRYLQVATISIALVPMIIALLSFGDYQASFAAAADILMFGFCLITSEATQKTFNGNFELIYDLDQAKKEMKTWLELTS